MIDKSQILKIIGLCIFIIVLAKALAPFIGEGLWNLIFGTKKKRNSDIDFDALISQKKAILRGSTTETQEGMNSRKSERKGQTEEIIQQSYQKLSSQKTRTSQEDKEFNELKEIMKVLDSLQWGNTPQIESIIKKLSQSYSHRFNPSQGTAHFKFLLEHNAFLDNKAQWIGLERAMGALETFTLLKELLFSSQLRSLIAKRWQMDHHCIDKSLTLKLSRKKKNLTNLINSAQVAPPQLNDREILSYLIINAGVLKNKTTILSEIKSQAEIFHALAPLPLIKSDKDKESAFKCLALKPGSTLEQIKSSYKKLARLKHPDTLRAKGIPKEFESIATENFTQIKRAYDILVKE